MREERNGEKEVGKTSREEKWEEREESGGEGREKRC